MQRIIKSTALLKLRGKIICASFSFAGVVFLVGCASFSFPYRPDVQQGNIINPETLARIHPGMSQREIIYLLGSPLLQDPFHSERWDYYYSLKKLDAPFVQKRAILYFHEQQLERVIVEPAL